MEKGQHSRKVERSELVEGDHIYSWRSILSVAYAHHGIYVSKNKVIHFVNQSEGKGIPGYSDFISKISETRPGPPAGSTSISRMSQPRTFRLSNAGFILSSKGTISPGGFSSSSKSDVPPSTCPNPQDCGNPKPGNGVVVSCLDCFLGKNTSLCRYHYEVSRSTFEKERGGTCTTANSLTPEKVIYNAMYLHINGFGNYDLVTNNCEDFALYCKTGLLVPNKKAPGTSSQINFILAVARGGSNHDSKRYFHDIGVRNDVMGVAVEKVAAFHKCREGRNEQGQGVEP